MQCARCKGSDLDERIATEERPYAFTPSGLSSVFLCGIKVERCEKCGLESPSIPRLGQLLDVIAGDLLRKRSRLTGEEVRYLRKHVGLAAGAFAALVRVTPEHFSRLENGKTSVTEPIDRLTRAVVSARQDSDFLFEILLKWAEELRETKGLAPPCFELAGEEWRRTAAA